MRDFSPENQEIKKELYEKEYREPGVSGKRPPILRGKPIKKGCTFFWVQPQNRLSGLFFFFSFYLAYEGFESAVKGFFK